MPVTLRPMSADQLPQWLRRSAAEYAQDLVALGQPGAEAQQEAVRDMAGWFPGGLPKPGHVVFDVANDTGTVVGYLWIGPSNDGDGNGDGDGDAWWVWDIVIDEDHRGRGFGRATMKLAEEYATARGARTLGLSVFGFNTAARGLYASLGYEVRTVKMTKSLR